MTSARVRMFELCDTASDRGGLISVLGAGIDLISRDQYPNDLGAMIAISVEIDAYQVGEKVALRLSIQKQNGDPIAEDYINELAAVPSAELEEHFRDPGAAVFVHVVGVQRMQIPEPGRYVMKLSVDDVPVGSLQFLAQ
ncbi:DUF6941 family protein [Agromyces albus]|uniref:DUF6941 family protein n=1 Tax=Agromyces albus TaxID=205332 RepID=UPI00277E7B89|nr:hypothetical protein [Agromyces albus]MDQ0574303.1 hypothetical protein [Agromyces albus]